MPGSVSAILNAAEAGDATVFDQLFPLVYNKLREMAHGRLMGERAGHTLNTTALVHEAYLKLVDHKNVTAHGEAYFYGAAARAMRQVLVDHARRRTRGKRGGTREALTLQEDRIAVDALSEELLDLDKALDRLSEFDERAARVVELRYFGGRSIDETAGILDVSSRSVKRDWTAARIWLLRELKH